MNKIPNLFVLLKERNVSRKELCSAIGVTNSNITGWKNGDYAPSIDVVIQIAHYFNVSTDYLLGVSEKKIAPIVTTEGELQDRLNQLSDVDLDELLNYLDYLDYKHSRS